MEKQDYIDKMIALQGNDDIASIHGEADDILCQFLIDLGHNDLVEEYNKVDKWYS